MKDETWLQRGDGDFGNGQGGVIDPAKLHPSRLQKRVDRLLMLTRKSDAGLKGKKRTARPAQLGAVGGRTKQLYNCTGLRSEP